MFREADMAQKGQDADYVVWRRYLELSGDRAMVARLEAMNAVEAAGKASMPLPDGGETRVPLMIASEAAVAAMNGEDEAAWRHEWTRRLVRLAVKWQDEPTTEGVVSVLSLTDAVIAELKSAGTWPWGAKGAESAA